MVIIEAMACGVVLIRTSAGGAYDQIENGVNGFIIPFNDVDMLATRLLQLAENAGELMTLSTVTTYKQAIATSLKVT